MVAALVIRDAVGDAISRQQAAVKPGPCMAGQARRRRSALAGPSVGHGRPNLEPSAGTFTGGCLPAPTGAPFTSTSTDPPPPAPPSGSGLPRSALRAEREALPNRKRTGQLVVSLSVAAMPDPIELVELAIAQRERGTMHPSMDSYDGAMAQTWGGPPPRWYPAALEQWPSRFAAAAGRRALVTGGTGGIGFYVAKLLCRVGLTVILPSRPDLSHEAASAAAAISAAVPDAAVVVPEVPLDLGSFASVHAFGAHMRASGSAPIGLAPTQTASFPLNRGHPKASCGHIRHTRYGRGDRQTPRPTTSHRNHRG